MHRRLQVVPSPHHIYQYLSLHHLHVLGVALALFQLWCRCRDSMKYKHISLFNFLFFHTLTRTPFSGVEQGFGQTCAHGSKPTSKVAGMGDEATPVKGYLLKHSIVQFPAPTAVGPPSFEEKEKHPQENRDQCA